MLLQQCLAYAVGGSGCLVLVGGEAGIGKTALVDHLTLHAARQGALVLSGHCYDLTTIPPYGPWIEILNSAQNRGTSPTHPVAESGITSVASQTEFFEHVRTELETIAEGQPLLVILEDLHWIDPASLELLRFLARNLAARRILLAVTYRDDEVTRGHPLYHTIPALIRESRPERLTLRRLGQPAIREFVAAHYPLSHEDENRLVDYLQHMTDGNPFFIEELLHTLEEEGVLSISGSYWTLETLDSVQVPSLIQQVVDRRLTRLSRTAVDLLEVAAIIGEEIPVGLWSKVTGHARDDIAAVIEQVIEARVMEEAAGLGNLRFRHALVRQALYERMVSVRRQIWHRRVAEALMEHPNPEPNALVYHFQQAGDPRAFDWLIEAGMRAQRLYAPWAAIEHLSTALQMAGNLSVSVPLAAYRARGLAYDTAGDFQRARADFLTAQSMARASGAREDEWQALIDLGMLWSERDYARAGEYYHQALDLAREMGDRTIIGHSLNRMGNWHLNVEQPREAFERHEEALAIFEEINDRGGVATTLDLLGMTSCLSSDILRGTAHYQQAVQLFEELGDRFGMSSSLTTLVMRSATDQTITMVIDNAPLAESANDGELALKIARDIGWRAGESYALWMLGFSYVAQGDYGRALEAGQRGLQIAEENEHRQWITAASFMLGQASIHLFALPLARQHLERGLELAHQVGSWHWIRAITGSLACACIEAGDLAQAESVLNATLGPETPALSLGQRQSWCARAELAIALRQPEVALSIVEKLQNEAPNADTGQPILRLSMLRGRALAQLQRYAEAETELLAARRLAAHHGARTFLWRIHAELGRLYLTQSIDDRAELACEQARQIVTALSNTVLDDTMRQQFLASALARVPEVSPLTPLQAAKRAYDGLTARQRDVAGLIAEGRTNREIADRLSVSERTVETHVSHILTTLDFSSRSQIAVWAADKGLLNQR